MGTDGFGVNSALCHPIWISPVMLTGLVMLPMAANCGIQQLQELLPWWFLVPQETAQISTHSKWRRNPAGISWNPWMEISVPVTAPQPLCKAGNAVPWPWLASQALSPLLQGHSRVSLLWHLENLTKHPAEVPKVYLFFPLLMVTKLRNFFLLTWCTRRAARSPLSP